VDALYENTGGWLQTTYSLPNITLPNGTTSPTVLPQLERAVTQFAGNNANGLFLPFSGSGIPGQSYGTANGGTGSGVHSALTNFGALGNGTAGTASGSFGNFSNGTDRTVNFELSRTNNVVSFKAGDRTWTSAAADYYRDANAIQFRIRTTSNANSDNKISYEDLKYSDENTIEESLSSIEAESGEVTIKLLSGVEGNFKLTGSFKYDVSGTGVGGWNSQLKLLSLPSLGIPPVVPEPASMAIFGLLGGTLGWSRWRQRKARN
jgi:hypothetical protein